MRVENTLKLNILELIEMYSFIRYAQLKWKYYVLKS